MHADNCWGAVDGQFAGPKALRILMVCHADSFYDADAADDDDDVDDDHGVL